VVATVVAAAPPPSSSPPQPASRQPTASTATTTSQRERLNCASFAVTGDTRMWTKGNRPLKSAQEPRAGMAVVSLDSASVVHGEETMTTMCSIPRAAAAAQRRANWSLDSPASRRVLSVFSIAS